MKVYPKWARRMSLTHWCTVPANHPLSVPVNRPNIELFSTVSITLLQGNKCKSIRNERSKVHESIKIFMHLVIFRFVSACLLTIRIR